MPKGPQRVAPLSKKVAKKAVVKPVSRSEAQTGILTDERPPVLSTHFDRAKWNSANRHTKGDWT